MLLRTAVTVSAVLGISLVAVLWWNYTQRLNNRFDTLETIRTGMPVKSLLARGFKPFVEGQLAYQGRQAKFFRFRSSSGLGTGPKSMDFGVIANQSGIIDVAFPLSTDEQRELWTSLTGDR